MNPTINDDDTNPADFDYAAYQNGYRDGAQDGYTEGFNDAVNQMRADITDDLTNSKTLFHDYPGLRRATELLNKLGES